MSNPKVVFEAVPSRWRVENRIRDGKWVGDQCFPTLAAATIYAQKRLDNNPDVYAYRVVDTQPEEVATGRRIVEDVTTSDQIAKVAAVGANLQWSKPSDLAEMSINAHQLTVPLTMDTYQQQARVAVANTMRQIEPNLYKNPANPEIYYGHLADDAIRAAAPHLRAGIAEEVRDLRSQFHDDAKTAFGRIGSSTEAYLNALDDVLTLLEGGDNQ